MKPTFRSSSFAVAALSSTLTAQTFTFSRDHSKSLEEAVPLISPDGLVPVQASRFSTLPNFSGLTAIPQTRVSIYKAFKSSNASGYQLNQSVISILGFEAFQRLETFKTLKKGWSFGGGKELSVDSLMSLESFIDEAGETIFPEYKHPLIYLNPNGEIEILWRKNSDKEIFLRFHDSYADYLVTPGDLEGTDDILTVATMIKESVRST